MVQNICYSKTIIATISATVWSFLTRFVEDFDIVKLLVITSTENLDQNTLFRSCTLNSKEEFDFQDKIVYWLIKRWILVPDTKTRESVDDIYKRIVLLKI